MSSRGGLCWPCDCIHLMSMNEIPQEICHCTWPAVTKVPRVFWNVYYRNDKRRFWMSTADCLCTLLSQVPRYGTMAWLISWNACPQYGGTLDKVTGLPAFLLAVVPDPVIVQRATKRLAADTCGSLWRFMPATAQQRALAKAQSQIDLHHLSTVYELLRAAPNVLTCL
jgi:hypothetical protein